MQQLYFADDTDHPLADELRNCFDAHLLPESGMSALDTGDPDVPGVVMDLGRGDTRCRQAPAELFQEAMDAGSPVVLLNGADPNAMVGLLGVGLASECAIARPQQNGSIVLDVLDGAAMELEEDHGLVEVEQDRASSRAASRSVTGDRKAGANQPVLGEYASLSARGRAKVVEEVLSSHDENEFECYEASGVGDSPGDLPQDQVKTVYVKIPLSRPIDGEKERQRFTNGVVMEITLLASYDNPPYKYLRVRSLGAGFAPASGGHLHWNGTYDRGWFQNRVGIHMQPESADLTTLQSSPANASGKHSVTTGTSVNVGVNVSENPSFNSSYTVSSSETHEIEDFGVTNNSSGSTASWSYQLGMTASNFFDIFDRPTLKKGRVKALPTLARANLQTSCAAVWFVPKSFAGTVPVQLYWSAAYYNAWVTGNWLKFRMHYKGWSWERIGRTVRVDFSRVSA